MKSKNWLVFLLIISFVLQGCGTPVTPNIVPTDETLTQLPTIDASLLSTIDFSASTETKYTLGDNSIPISIPIYESKGTYKNAKLNQEFNVIITGYSQKAVDEYAQSAKFYFEAIPSLNHPKENAPTPTPDPDMKTEFSIFDMFSLKDDSLLIEFHLADANAKSFADNKQDYDLNFIIDPTIPSTGRYHNYRAKTSRTSATETLSVTAINDGVAGQAIARLYRRSANQATANTACSLVRVTLTLNEGTNQQITYSATPAVSYDLVVEGITRPVTYSLSGAWTTPSDSIESTSSTASCP